MDKLYRFNYTRKDATEGHMTIFSDTVQAAHNAFLNRIAQLQYEADINGITFATRNDFNAGQFYLDAKDGTTHAFDSAQLQKAETLQNELLTNPTELTELNNFAYSVIAAQNSHNVSLEKAANIYLFQVSAFDGVTGQSWLYKAENAQQVMDFLDTRKVELKGTEILGIKLATGDDIRPNRSATDISDGKIDYMSADEMRAIIDSQRDISDVEREKILAFKEPEKEKAETKDYSGVEHMMGEPLFNALKRYCTKKEFSLDELLDDKVSWSEFEKELLNDTEQKNQFLGEVLKKYVAPAQKDRLTGAIEMGIVPENYERLVRLYYLDSFSNTDIHMRPETEMVTKVLGSVDLEAAKVFLAETAVEEGNALFPVEFHVNGQGVKIENGRPFYDALGDSTPLSRQQADAFIKNKLLGNATKENVFNMDSLLYRANIGNVMKKISKTDEHNAFYINYAIQKGTEKYNNLFPNKEEKEMSADKLMEKAQGIKAGSKLAEIKGLGTQSDKSADKGTPKKEQER